MEPPMHADRRRSELLPETGEISKLIEMHLVIKRCNRVEFRVGVHRRESAVSSPFSHWS
jgi:hypothetical protein